MTVCTLFPATGNDRGEAGIQRQAEMRDGEIDVF